MEKANRQSGARLVCYSLILIALVAATSKKIYDWDIWYHLTIGREIFQTLHIPAREFFVYPQLGQPVSFHEWGFGVFFYAAYKLFGYEGMGVANALLGGCALFLFFLAAGGGRREVAALLLVPLFWVVDYRLMYRPEMFLFLFLGLELFLLERFCRDGNWKWLYPLPILAALLNHFHPSALFLLFVLVAYSAQFLVDAFLRDKKTVPPLLARLAAIFAVTFLVSGVNPYGFEQTLLPLQFAQSTELLQQVAEFIPTFRTPLKLHFCAIAFCGLLALCFQPRRRIVDWLLVITFGYLGLRYVRNVALFAFIAYLPVVRTLTARTESFPALNKAGARRVSWGVVAAAMLATVSARAMTAQWGVGVSKGQFPEKATNVMRALQPPGRLFNSYATGGYFAWQLYDKYLVSIDGRHYGMDRSYQENLQVFDAKPGWQGVLEGYGVSTIFIPATSPITGVLVDLLPLLDADEGWILVSAERGGLLYMRREVLPTQGWPMPDQNEAWRQVIREAQGISVAPEHADAYFSMSVAYFNLHRLAESVTYLRKYTELTPGDVVAARTLADLERGGRFDPAAMPPSGKHRVF